MDEKLFEWSFEQYISKFQGWYWFHMGVILPSNAVDFTSLASCKRSIMPSVQLIFPSTL